VGASSFDIWFDNKKLTSHVSKEPKILTIMFPKNRNQKKLPVMFPKNQRSKNSPVMVFEEPKIKKLTSHKP
jgi:hypothetical protein